MSRKNHKIVNGRLLQMDKQYSDLKQNQKGQIAGWLYEDYRSIRQDTRRDLDKAQFAELLENVYGKIQEAKIWIPYRAFVQYCSGRKNHLRKRFNREVERLGKTDGV